MADQPKKKFDFSTMHLSDIPKLIVALFKGELGKQEGMMTTQTGKYEINLVPDVKSEMIKKQKLRNVVFFGCIVVSVVAVGITAVLGSIKAAQDVTMTSQDAHMKKLSSKITSYSELTEFLTVQNQINGISKVEDNQKVLSRAFPLLSSLIPGGNDTVEVSEISVDLKTSTMNFDAQANAGEKPYIDYRVLESFIKRTNMMKFDYGRYVDEDGNEIPSRCLIEYDDNGSMLNENGSIYAIWTRGRKGCDPSRDDYTNSSEENDRSISKLGLTDFNATKITGNSTEVANANGQEKTNKVIDVVPNEKIYRTPQFDKWSKGTKVETAKDGIADDDPKSDKPNTVYNVMKYTYTPSMTTDGKISGVPHFESRCITYSGTAATDSNGDSTTKWSADNECVLVPDGIQVTDSSNGRNADDQLVLRFTAVITFNPEVFAYRNKHVMAIGPNGQNVTDSYLQLEKIFTAPATDCEAGDTECQNASTGGN